MTELEITFKDKIRTITMKDTCVEARRLSEISEIIRALEYIRKELEDIQRAKFSECQ